MAGGVARSSYSVSMRLAVQGYGCPVNVPRFAKRMPKIKKNEKLVHCAIIIYILSPRNKRVNSPS